MVLTDLKLFLLNFDSFYAGFVIVINDFDRFTQFFDQVCTGCQPILTRLHRFFHLFGQVITVLECFVHVLPSFKRMHTFCTVLDLFPLFWTNSDRY